MSGSENKVLIVDDNNINLKLLNKILVDASYEVLQASSGKQALQIAAREKPGMILLDVMMPDMDGYETCRHLKEKEETRHIPIIFLSAKNESVDKAKGLALGAVDYLTKPFEPVEIIARIRTQIAAHQHVIELYSKNELLKSELNKLRSQSKGDGRDNEIFNYLNKLKSVTYRNRTGALNIVVRTKFSHPPVNTVFLPVHISPQYFIYVVLCGFEKDYKTTIVQLILEKYILGYLQGGFLDHTIDEQALLVLFEQILDTFSPDVYETAFTISLSMIDTGSHQLITFLISQSLPLVLDASGKPFQVESFPVLVESKYNKITNVRRLKLPPHSTLLNFYSGRERTTPEQLENLYKTIAAEARGDIAYLADIIYDGLPTREQDQLVSLIRFM